MKLIYQENQREKIESLICNLKGLPGVTFNPNMKIICVKKPRYSHAVEKLMPCSTFIFCWHR